MDDSLTPSRLAAEKRLRVKRRAKRGLIASYIHELSERHRDDVLARPTGTPDVAPPPAAAEGTVSEVPDRDRHAAGR